MERHDTSRCFAGHCHSTYAMYRSQCSSNPSWCCYQQVLKSVLHCVVHPWVVYTNTIKHSMINCQEEKKKMRRAVSDDDEWEPGRLRAGTRRAHSHMSIEPPVFLSIAIWCFLFSFFFFLFSRCIHLMIMYFHPHFFPTRLSGEQYYNSFPLFWIFC